MTIGPTPTKLVVLAGLASLLLTSCYKEPSVLPRPAPAVPTPAAPPAAREVATLDEYKTLVARCIVAANPKVIFNGQLPPMLPAIVVVDFGIDGNGQVNSLKVHRSRDDDASTIALDAIKLAAPYPKPGALLKGWHKSLQLTETFLFNRDYQFQLRTLAGPQ